MSTTDDIAGLFEQYECGITYTPLESEPDPLKIFSLISPKVVHAVEPDLALDPIEESRKAQEVVGNRSAFILVPGQLFDSRGTRHGRGAGWYDRFLSVAPRNWLRVGICHENQFSHDTLARESWDETMDFVVVVDRKTQEVTCHETHARDGTD
jgi:5,10-methenyltetrahydrofolate synthetase